MSAPHPSTDRLRAYLDERSLDPKVPLMNRDSRVRAGRLLVLGPAMLLAIVYSAFVLGILLWADVSPRAGAQLQQFSVVDRFRMLFDSVLDYLGTFWNGLVEASAIGGLLDHMSPLRRLVFMVLFLLLLLVVVSGLIRPAIGYLRKSLWVHDRGTNGWNSS